MFVLVEQLGNELVWLEWMLGNPGARSFRQELDLLQRSLIAAMDNLIQEQPVLPDSILHEINQHFQAVRNAIAHDSKAVQPAVQAVCKRLEMLRLSLGVEAEAQR